MTVCMRIFSILNINVSSFDWPNACLNFPWLIQFALTHGGGADFSCSIGSLTQDFHCFTWLQSSHWRLAGGTTQHRKHHRPHRKINCSFFGKTYAIMYICFVHLVVLSYQVHYVNICLYTFHIDEYIYIYMFNCLYLKYPGCSIPFLTARTSTLMMPAEPVTSVVPVAMDTAASVA